MNKRDAKGCFGIQERIVHEHRLSGVKFFKCPANYMSSEVKYYIDLMLKKEKGYQVFEGSLENKSAKLVELLDILDNLLSEFRRKENSNNGKS